MRKLEHQGIHEVVLCRAIISCCTTETVPYDKKNITFMHAWPLYKKSRRWRRWQLFMPGISTTLGPLAWTLSPRMRRTKGLADAIINLWALNVVLSSHMNVMSA